MHSLNTVFALFELVLTNSEPLPWLYLPATLVVMGLYLALAYVAKLSLGFYRKSLVYICSDRIGRCANDPG